MAEKRINANTDRPQRFTIPVDQARVSDFPDMAEVMLDLDVAHAERFDVFQKDIPDQVKNLRFNRRKIKWLNNFGLKARGSDAFEASVPRYSILLNRVEGSLFVYYDGARVQRLEVTPDENEPDKVRAFLDLGDPPVGIVKE